MLADLWVCCRAVWRFRGYKPQPVTFSSINNWLWQFDKKDRKALLCLLDKVVYITESKTRNLLVSQNRALLNKLARSGIPPKKVIYVQVDEAGSSSPVMLNMLKEAALLERQGCRFIDSKDVMGLYKATNELEEGAIVYVDDFAGTGSQFCSSRDFVVQHIVGSFSEFFLLPCICEEAIYELAKRGIEAFSGYIHSKAERPLHENGMILDLETKKRLVNLCLKIDPKGGLGYKGLASNVVFYRNSPNTMPLVLRGNIKQRPHAGVFPRTTDLTSESSGDSA